MVFIKNRLIVLGLCAMTGGIAGFYKEYSRQDDDGAAKAGGMASRDNTQIRVLTKEVPALLVQGDQPLEYTFSIQNDTDSVLRLMKPQHSCSCSHVQLDRNSIGPNEESKLEFRIDPRNRQGQQRFVCDVPSDSGITWRCQVLIDLIPIAYLDVERVSFSNIQLGQKAVKTVNLFIHTNRQMKNAPILKKCESFGKEIRATIGKAGMEELSDGIQKWRYPITIELLPQSEASDEQATLIDIKYSINREEHQIQLPVKWLVHGWLEVSPTRVYFGKINKDAGTVRKTVKIERKDGERFQIGKITPSNDAISCCVIKAESESITRYWVEITLKPEKMESFIHGDIKIDIVVDTKERTLRIPYTAYK